MSIKMNQFTFTNENFDFKLFGVPKGFDLSHGTKEDISYYQLFYDGNPLKNNPRFYMEKRNENKLAYIYLRNGKMFDVDSRSGSFLGMSLEFNGIYCKDYKGLYSLFDAIFENIIVGNKILSKIGQNYQFKVDSFKTVNTNIIKNIFKKNLNNQFSEDFIKLEDVIISSNKLYPNMLYYIDLNKSH